MSCLRLPALGSDSHRLIGYGAESWQGHHKIALGRGDLWRRPLQKYASRIVTYSRDRRAVAVVDHIATSQMWGAHAVADAVVASPPLPCPVRLSGASRLCREPHPCENERLACDGLRFICGSAFFWWVIAVVCLFIGPPTQLTQPRDFYGTSHAPFLLARPPGSNKPSIAFVRPVCGSFGSSSR